MIDIFIRQPEHGRRFDGFVADVRGGELQALAHKDLSDRAIYSPCTVCGHPEGSQRCDAPIKATDRLCCDRLMCRACAVHIPSKSDCDYCPDCAKKNGVTQRGLGYSIAIAR